jgi:hypothetical protein
LQGEPYFCVKQSYRQDSGVLQYTTTMVEYPYVCFDTSFVPQDVRNMVNWVELLQDRVRVCWIKGIGCHEVRITRLLTGKALKTVNVYPLLKAGT